MRRPAQSILVEFWLMEEGRNKEFIVALDLLQAPAVGEAVQFAKVEKYQGHFSVTKVKWFVGIATAEGRTIEPGPDGTAFQITTVGVKRA